MKSIGDNQAARRKTTSNSCFLFSNSSSDAELEKSTFDRTYLLSHLTNHSDRRVPKGRGSRRARGVYNNMRWLNLSRNQTGQNGQTPPPESIVSNDSLVCSTGGCVSAAQSETPIAQSLLIAFSVVESDFPQAAGYVQLPIALR